MKKLVLLAVGMALALPLGLPAPVQAEPGPWNEIASVLIDPCAEPRTLMALGDSMTQGAVIGQSVTEGWLGQFQRNVATTCLDLTVVNLAVGGTTCGYWNQVESNGKTRILNAYLTHRPDYVVIACGTNDNLSTMTQAQITAWEGLTYRTMADQIADEDDKNLVVETIILPSLVQYSAKLDTAGVAQCQALGGQPTPSFFPASQPKVNDAIYRAITAMAEWNTPRIPLFFDWQNLDNNWQDECGVHLTPEGYEVMGQVATQRFVGLYSTQTFQTPCGLTGHRDGYPVPSHIPCRTDVIP